MDRETRPRDGPGARLAGWLGRWGADLLLGLGAVLKSFGVALALGGAGAVVGYIVLVGLSLGFGPLSGSVPQAFAYILAGGCAALLVTYGPAVKGNWPEASFISGAVRKVARKLRS